MGFCAAVMSGAVLYVVSRKLTWGVDESIWSSPLWTLAFVPYWLGILLGQIIPSHEPVVARYLRSSIVWTVSLALYVVAHATTLSRFIDEPVYASFGLSSLSFVMLTSIYVTVSLVLACAADVALRPGSPDLEGPRSPELLRHRTLVLGYLLSLPMFFLFVFDLPL